MESGGVEIVASVLNFVNMSLLSLLLVRKIQHKDEVQVQDVQYGQQRTYILAELCGGFCVLSATMTAVGFCMTGNRTADLPHQMLGSSTENLLTDAFIVWAVSLASSIVFILVMILIKGTNLHRETQSIPVESENHSLSNMNKTRQQQKQHFADSADYTGSNSVNLITLPAPVKYSHFRNSLSQDKAQSSELKGFGYRQRTSFVQDGFRFGDTYTAEPYVRQAVLGKSSSKLNLSNTPLITSTDRRCSNPGIPFDSEVVARSEPRSASYGSVNNYRGVTR
ncbi:hypothetical protein F5884DRAFT_757729 [Xylogone sp. PMI_703]|nr:hypothetical protein F5884DRAFT_757729 [Xylogone sp. PMI_703]